MVLSLGDAFYKDGVAGPDDPRWVCHGSRVGNYSIKHQLHSYCAQRSDLRALRAENIYSA